MENKKKIINEKTNEYLKNLGIPWKIPVYFEDLLKKFLMQYFE